MVNPSWRTQVLLLLLALGLRLALAVALYSRPSLFDPSYVTDNWDNIARNLLHGRGFSWVEDGSVPTMTRGPGYTVYLAALMLVTRDDLLLMRIIYLALDSAMAVAVLRMGCRVFNDRATGTVAGLFYAIYLLPAWHIMKLAPDALFSFVLFMALAAFVAMVESKQRGFRSTWLAVLAGILFGFAILTKQTAVLLLPVWVGVLLLQRQNYRAVVPSVLVWVVAAGIIVTPWLYRNYRLAGTIAPTETLTWFNYWYGDFADRNMSNMSAEEFSNAAADYIRNLGGSGIYLPYSLPPRVDLEREKLFRNLAFHQIKSEPGHVVAKSMRNVPRFWYMIETGRMTRPSRVIGGLVGALFVSGSILSLLRWRRSPGAMLMLSTVVCFNLAYAPVFSIMRYMIPVVPYVAMFVGIVLVDLARRARKPQRLVLA